jgi:hypothetical protein
MKVVIKPTPALLVGLFVLSVVAVLVSWFFLMPGSMGPIYLEGHVVDPGGRGISFAKVDVRSTALSYIRETTTTDTAGRYSIVLINIPPKGELVVRVVTTDGQIETHQLARPAGNVTHVQSNFRMKGGNGR